MPEGKDTSKGSPEELGDVHPKVREAEEQLREGKITRRQFLYIATLLGVPAAVAVCWGGSTLGMKAVNNLTSSEPGYTPITSAVTPTIEEVTDTPTAAPSPTRTPEPTETATPNPTETATPEPTETATMTPSPTETTAVEPSDTPAPGVQSGTMIIGANFTTFSHPASISSLANSNIIRQVAEYLTITDENNITHPYLLESWAPNDDLTEWTLNVRQGVFFNNGDELTAEDVYFTFSQWLDPNVGSSMRGLLSYLSGMSDVELVDTWTIRLHLRFPSIEVPEHLYHYPAVILHRDFDGDFLANPVGTGAFTLEEFVDNQRAIFKARPDYWRLDAEGRRLPYLEEIIYIALDNNTALQAMQSGEIDMMSWVRFYDWQALKDRPELTVHSVQTADALVLKMRVDREPWNDVRVRKAMKMCQDRQRILDLTWAGEGVTAMDAHVAPVHPAYCPLDIPAYDPDGARTLLEAWAAETGNSLPLQVTLVSKNDEGEPDYAQALKEMAAPAGFEIELDITEPNGYWDRWTLVDFGITSWVGRVLDTMVLPLGYVAGATWNETRWSDDGFEVLLDLASTTLDVDARREIMCLIQAIMQEEGPIGISFFKKKWKIARSNFQNVKALPFDYDLLYEVSDGSIA